MKLTNEMKEQARAELERMAKMNGGKITPQEVVEAAKDPESPLHGCFEWDNDQAADSFRLMQARALIRSVKIVVKTETTKVKAVGFVRDPSRESSDAGYVSVTSIKNDEDMKRDVLIAEFARAAAAIKRARALATVFGLTHEVDEFLERLDYMRGRVMEATPERMAS
jgi:hypothetical protein